MILTLVVLFTLLGSVCSVGFAGLLLLFKGPRLGIVTGRLRSLVWELPLTALGIGTIVALRLAVVPGGK